MGANDSEASLTSDPVPFANLFSIMMSVNALRVMRMPWPMSPNITANKKGNVITVNNPGFTSWYDPMPYASMMFWNPSVNLFVRWNVGGVAVVRNWCKTAETEVLAFSCGPRHRQR